MPILMQILEALTLSLSMLRSCICSMRQDTRKATTLETQSPGKPKKSQHARLMSNACEPHFIGKGNKAQETGLC